jgi:hypothetical protein
MLQKQVQVTKINTLADGTIRLTIDLLNGNGDDIQQAYALREAETTMVLVETAVLNENQQIVAGQN